MLDYQQSAPPSTTIPHRQQPPISQTANYLQAQTETYYPNLPSRQRVPSQELSSHRHTRSASSSVLPSTQATSPAVPASQNYTDPDTTQPDPYRSSAGTYSTHKSNSMNMQRQGTTGSTASAPRRSTSSRSSTNTPTSYVALMRKQKATVWCDRSQNIDPRIAAAHRAAKQRAVLEVHGGNNGAARTSTINSGGVVGKIRHGGVPKAPGYVPVNLSGAGVPMRLSANEMLGDDEEGRALGDNSMAHGRSGSGRSSTNSTKYRSGYPRADQGRYSASNTPPTGADGGSPQERIDEGSETPGPGTYNKKDYFDAKGGNVETTQLESEDSFGDLKDMAAPSAVKRAESKMGTADDLRRRGSVDERAMSMGAGVRLYVANPGPDD